MDIAFRIMVKPIKLANEATMVPKPPMLTPINKLYAWSVKGETRIVVGTFEKTCEAKSPVR